MDVWTTVVLPILAALGGFFASRVFPVMAARWQRTDEQAGEKISANIKTEGEAFQQALRLNEKLVEDVLADKNVSLKEIKDILSQIILHNRQEAEWFHTFAESIEELAGNIEKLREVVLQTKHMIAAELTTRRILNSIISDIYERLFDELPKLSKMMDREHD